MESDQHTADAQLLRDAYGDSETIKRMTPEDFKKTIESLLQKIRKSDSDWTMLQRRTGALKSEVDALITSATPSVTNAQTQTDVGNAVIGGKEPEILETAVNEESMITVELPGSKVAQRFPHDVVLGGQTAIQDAALSRDTMRQVDAIQDGIQTELARYRELTEKLLQQITMLETKQTLPNIEVAATLLNNAVLELFSHTCPASIAGAGSKCKCSMPKALRSDDPLWKGTPWTQRSCIAFVKCGICDREVSGQKCCYAHDYRTERKRVESKEVQKAHREASRLEAEFEMEFGDSYRILQAQLRHQLELMLNGMLQMNVSATIAQSSATKEGAVTEVPKTTHHESVANPNDSLTAPKSSDGGHLLVANSQASSTSRRTALPTISIEPASQSPELKFRKRAHSELSADAGSESEREHQKRRTGFANYADLSNPACQQGAAPATISKGFGSFNGGFRPSPNPREITSGGKIGTTDLATMKASLGPYLVQSRKTTSSTTSPPRNSLQVPDVGLETSQIDKPMARIVNFRTNTEVQNPGKVPTGPRKWHDPSLRKDRRGL